MPTANLNKWMLTIASKAKATNSAKNSKTANFIFFPSFRLFLTVVPMITKTVPSLDFLVMLGQKKKAPEKQELFLIFSDYFFLRFGFMAFDDVKTALDASRVPKPIADLLIELPVVGSDGVAGLAGAGVDGVLGDAGAVLVL